MKSNLSNLLIVSVVTFCMCGSAIARSTQPTKPLIRLLAPPEATAVSDGMSFSTVPIEQGDYYIRNSEAGAFLAGANSWGTRLSLKSSGDLIRITRKTAIESYEFMDLSLIDATTGKFIGEPSNNDDLQLFIDQRTAPSGYTFHKLTAEEVAAIDAEDGSTLGRGVGKDYYYIMYTNKRGQKVFLSQAAKGISGHSEVSGLAIEAGRTNPGSRAVWEVLSKDELAQDLLDNASKDYMMSATPFITNADFSRNCNAGNQPNTNGWISTGLTNIYAENSADGGKNYVANADHSPFHVYQTLTGIPNGNYLLIAYGVYNASSEYGSGNPYLYASASGVQQSMPFKYSKEAVTLMSMSNAVISSNKDIQKKYLLEDSIRVTVWDNTLTVGLKGDRADANVFFDNVQLFYKGMVDDDNILDAQLDLVRKDALKILSENKAMNADVKEALKDASLLFPKDKNDAKEMNSIINQIASAVENARESVKLYGELVNKYSPLVSALGEKGQQFYNDNVTVPLINAGKLLNEKQLENGYKAARIIDKGVGDVTSITIVNPSFEDVDHGKGWTHDSGGDTDFKNVITQPKPYSFSGSDGTYVYNTWNGDQVGYPISQTITLAPGRYVLRSTMVSKNIYFVHMNANEFMVTNPTDDSEQVGIPMELELEFDDITEATITAWASAAPDAKLDGNDKTWFKVDNFTLEYRGQRTTAEMYDKLVERIGNAGQLLAKKMQKDVRIELEYSKMQAEKVGKTNDTAIKQALADLDAKIAPAQASVLVYDNIGSIIVDERGKLDASGKLVFDQYIKDIERKWTDGLITDGKEEFESAEKTLVKAIKAQTKVGSEMTKAIDDWQCTSGYQMGQFKLEEGEFAIPKYWTTEYYDENDGNKLKPLTTINGVSVNKYFHVNTWSTEGDDGRDGSAQMTAPFTEFRSSAADNILGKNHIVIKHNSEEGYKPGRYTLSIRARLGEYNDNGTTTPKGYKFSANGNDSKTLFTHSGTAYYYASDEIDFFVGEDGKIDFQFDLDHTNFHWIAFKMIRLIYQGDTYSEEQAEKVIAEATDKYIGDLDMNRDVQQKVKDAIKAFAADNSIANGKALSDACQEAKNSLAVYEKVLKDIEVYEQKEKAYNNGKGFEGIGHENFINKITAIRDAYNNRTLTSDQKDDVVEAYRLGLFTQPKGDFTELIVNPGFEEDPVETRYKATGWTILNGSDDDVKVAPAYGDATYETQVDNIGVNGGEPLFDKLFNIWHSNEEHNGGGVIKQTIKNIPNGRYKVSAYVATYGNFSALVFGNDTYSNPVYQTGYDTDNAKRHALKAEVEVQVTNNELTIGAVGSIGGKVPDYPSEWGCWYKVDDFHLDYLGPITNKEYYEKLMTQCAYAEAHKDEPMNCVLKSEIIRVYDEAMATDETTDIDLLKMLTEELRACVDAALPSVNIYKELNVYFALGDSLDLMGQMKFKQLTKSVRDAYDNGEITDGKDELDILEDCLRVATKAQVEEGTDWTGAIYNPSFEHQRSMHHWLIESSEYKPFQAHSASKQGYEWKYVTGSRYAYRSNSSATKMKVNFYQEVDTMLTGVYKLRATIYTNSKTMSIYGNELTYNLIPCESADDVMEFEGILALFTPNLKLGVIGELGENEEFRIDNIRLEFLSHDLDIENLAVPDSVKMNEAVKAEQKKRVRTYSYDRQPDNLMPAILAISAAKESAKAYAKLKHYIDSAQNYMEHSNVFSESAKIQCDKLLKSIGEEWENGTLDNDDVADRLYQIYQNGFENFNYQNAVYPDTYNRYPVLNYIFDAWEIKRESQYSYGKADGNFKVNNWSPEVDPKKENRKPENSEMVIPYIEYWTSRDNDHLENATIHAKAIDLKPGLYKVRVLTRVANENNTVAPDEFRGITMNVTADRVRENNGKSLFMSDTISVCKGEIHKDGALNVVSQEFVIDNVIIRAKDNHDAHVYFNVNETNANWFNWKFCYFEWVRDLKFWEENDLASDEEIKQLRELIARDEKKPIGFSIYEYSPYENRDVIIAHNEAKAYLADSGKFDPVLGCRPLTKYKVNKYIKALYENPDDPSTFKWKIQTTDVNAVFNPNFWLVENNGRYPKLTGWKNTDPTVEDAGTGGMGLTTFNQSPEWFGFNNAKGSVNASGRENTFSTAATFVFPQKKQRTCSTHSVYSYGEQLGYEMPLDPGQAYSFSVQFGYRIQDEKESITFEIINIKTGHTVFRLDTVPQKCVSDTTQLLTVLDVKFNTDEVADRNYVNTLENWDKLQMYKLVVRNTDPTKAWTMVMSNIKFFRWPNAIMEIKPGAHWGTFIAPFDANIPDNVRAFVVTGKDDEAYKYEDPKSHEKILYTRLHVSSVVKDVVYKNEYKKSTVSMEMTKKIPAHVPVVIYTDLDEGIYAKVHGTVSDERLDSLRNYRVNNNHIYLEGWEGTKNPDNPTIMDPIIAKKGSYILQKHTNDNVACFYYVNKEMPKVQANRCYLIDPSIDMSNPTRIRRFVFEIDEQEEAEIMAGIDDVEDVETKKDDVTIIGIFSANGAPQDGFKPGINIIKMSDGTTKKRFLK